MSLYKLSIEKNERPKTTREASSKQEKQIAKRVGGKTTANSGATQFSKGDITTKNILIEAKTCMVDKESFSIKKQWLEKNKQESIFMGKDYNVLAFNFGPNKPNYYILDELTFQEFAEYLNAKKE